MYAGEMLISSLLQSIYVLPLLHITIASF